MRGSSSTSSNLVDWLAAGSGKCTAHNELLPIVNLFVFGNRLMSLSGDNPDVKGILGCNKLRLVDAHYISMDAETLMHTDNS